MIAFETVTPLHRPHHDSEDTSMADTLEQIADQITRTIYSSPFAQATRRQQELTLTCAQKICDAMQEAHTCPP